jgi:hypothetical protein
VSVATWGVLRLVLGAPLEPAEPERLPWLPLGSDWAWTMVQRRVQRLIERPAHPPGRHARCCADGHGHPVAERLELRNRHGASGDHWATGGVG